MYHKGRGPSQNSRGNSVDPHAEEHREKKKTTKTKTRLAKEDSSHESTEIVPIGSSEENQESIVSSTCGWTRVARTARIARVFGPCAPGGLHYDYLHIPEIDPRFSVDQYSGHLLRSKHIASMTLLTDPDLFLTLSQILDCAI